jgi:hypothetical protein
VRHGLLLPISFSGHSRRPFIKACPGIGGFPLRVLDSRLLCWLRLAPRKSPPLEIRSCASSRTIQSAVQRGNTRRIPACDHEQSGNPLRQFAGGALPRRSVETFCTSWFLGFSYALSWNLGKHRHFFAATSGQRCSVSDRRHHRGVPRYFKRETVPDYEAGILCCRKQLWRNGGDFCIATSQNKKSRGTRAGHGLAKAKYGFIPPDTEAHDRTRIRHCLSSSQPGLEETSNGPVFQSSGHHIARCSRKAAYYSLAR